MKKWLTAVAFLFLTTPAFAGGYASLGYTFSSIAPSGAGSDADVGALQFNFGTWLNAQGTFGAELRAALGVSNDELGDTGVEIDRYFGAYLRGQFPNSMRIRPYGLIGFTLVEATIGSSGETYSGLSLGIGVEVDVTQRLFVSLEYLRAVDRSEVEISNLTLSIGGRF